MYNWKVTIEVSPHFTGRGQEVDQKQAGARVQEYRITANDIYKALEVAETICLGLRQNPIVWKTTVVEITQSLEFKNNEKVACLTKRPEPYMD